MAAIPIADVNSSIRPRRRDDTYWRTFQSRFYGGAHAGTECIIHAVR